MYKMQVIYLKTVIQSEFAAQLCHSEYQILYALNHTYLPSDKTVVGVCRLCIMLLPAWSRDGRQNTVRNETERQKYSADLTYFVFVYTGVTGGTDQTSGGCSLC